MAELIRQGKTDLPYEDVIVRAVQYFSTVSWRPTSQSSRVATFQGKPPIPWFMLLITLLGFLFMVLPGVIMYIMVIRKMYRFQNLVVTANPIDGGTEVVVQYPKTTSRLVTGFFEALPPYGISSADAKEKTTLQQSDLSKSSETKHSNIGRLCKHCGAKPDADDRYCTECGNPIQ